jgi:Fe-S cluster assembly protein SufD
MKTDLLEEAPMKESEEPRARPQAPRGERPEVRPEPQAAAAVARYLADWQEFRRGLPAAEPESVRVLRGAAIERFAALGFPTLRQEDWRFTNVAPILRTAFHRDGVAGALPAAPANAPAVSSGSPAALAGASWTADPRLVFVNGHLAPELSSCGDLPAGVEAGSLAAALGRDPAAVEPHLGRYASFAAHPFVALNTAFLRDGAFIRLPRGLVLERPLHLVFLSFQPDGRPVVSYPRNLIVAGEGSQLTLVETYVGAGVYLSCPVTEMVVGPGAVVDHYKVQRESGEAFHMATFQIEGGRGSNFSSHSIAAGGSLVRNDVNAVLSGEGIDCNLNGLYLASGRQLIDNHMRVEHAQPHCSSHELYKGVLDGKARTVFNGLIYVHKGAQKTDAKQSNRNLLLSPDAIANSNPQLEIFANDVRCTHGSTVGQLDEDAVFYLRSRGIGREAARSLLTYAFASDIVDRIKVEPVRRDLEELLFNRLPKGDVVRQAV